MNDPAERAASLREEIAERRAAFEALAAAGLHDRAEYEMSLIDELERTLSEAEGLSLTGDGEARP